MIFMFLTREYIALGWETYRFGMENIGFRQGNIKMVLRLFRKE